MADCQNQINWQWAIARLAILTPPPAQAPHSSLVHMFETVRQKLGARRSRSFRRQIGDEWLMDFGFRRRARCACNNRQPAIVNPQLLLGTAFSFVHLLDYLVEKNLRFELPAGSRVMETGGYKNRSRSMPKVGIARAHHGAARHSARKHHLRIRHERIEFAGLRSRKSEIHRTSAITCFHFPPWARVQIISPETGREVADGETGLIRIFDLANVFSVAAIQTEDLGIRRGDGFELIGRAQLAEPRGCSLMTA